jgi:hypothetical protein
LQKEREIHLPNPIGRKRRKGKSTGEEGKDAQLPNTS